MTTRAICAICGCVEDCKRAKDKVDGDYWICDECNELYCEHKETE